jgi:cation diffusion facilitator family transporter
MTAPAAESRALAVRAGWVSIVATILVVAAKLAAAWATGSVSVLGEGLQSLVDVLISATAVAVLTASARPPDLTHPYGHGKVEVLSSAFQMLAVIASSLYILLEAYRRLADPSPIRVDWGLAAMAYAAVSNTAVGACLDHVARRTGSPALASEALHLRADTLGSLGVLVGLLLVWATGEPRVDPAAAVVFVLITVHLAVRRLRELAHPLVDGALPDEDLALLEATLRAHPETRGYHHVRTRMVGAQRHVELHLMLEDSLTFVRAHEIAEEIEQEVGRALAGAVVMIHYEPYEAEQAHQARAHAADPAERIAWTKRTLE